MRLGLCSKVMLLLVLAASGVRAQDTTPPYQPLPITIPQGAKVFMEIDAHQEDLLGVVKSLLEGINGQSLQAMMGSMGIQTSGAPPGSAAPGGPAMPSMQALAEVNLADLLKEIHQLHLVVFTPSPDSRVDDLQKVYNELYRNEGGRRIMWMDGGDMQFSMFGIGHGFAAVALSKDQVMVTRADGYPNLSKMGPLLALAGFFSLRMGASPEIHSTGPATSLPTDRVEVEPSPATPSPTTVVPAPPAHPAPPARKVTPRHNSP